MESGFILIFILMIMVAYLPLWRHSASWGYYPSGGVGLILFVAVIMQQAGWF